ncbi:MAG TPA: SAV_6107 family HEPN domain-containing protein [Mycobacteriales bacterium]|nr:SAV_6107 family HEPN domain-containing protein [Mycobacteriales bacterium]
MNPPGSASTIRLLAAARAAYAEATGARDAAERYAAAHMAALRAAAAVIADRSVPGGRRGRRPTSAWVLLPGVAPELAPWARHFAAAADKRAVAQAGVRGSVTAAEADQAVRDARDFLGLVETTLLVLPDLARRAG